MIDPMDHERNAAAFARAEPPGSAIRRAAEINREFDDLLTGAIPDASERMVGTCLEHFRRDHVARYEWARERMRALGAGSALDLGCGVGYGAMMLAADGAHVYAFDKDAATLAFAREHWRDPAIWHYDVDLETGAPDKAADVAVTFEIVEHLNDPRPMLRGLQCANLLISVPNEHALPWSPAIAHHRRHYTADQLADLLEECGWRVVLWASQAGPESEVVPAHSSTWANRRRQDRTLIAQAVRCAPRVTVTNHTDEPVTASQAPDGSVDVQAGAPAWTHPTGRAPRSVMLCGLGPSKYELTEGMIGHDFAAEWDELWTVNKGIALFPGAAATFIMDDVNDYASRHPTYGEEMRRYTAGGGHIIGQSTIAHDAGVPFHEYPLESVIRHWGGSAANWLHTISIGYILAYAGAIGVERLLLAGIDCSWPDRPDLTEAGVSTVCYWIGRLEGQGVEVAINSSSVLNSTRRRGEYGWRQFYGYLRQPQF